MIYCGQTLVPAKIFYTPTADVTQTNTTIKVTQITTSRFTLRKTRNSIYFIPGSVRHLEGLCQSETKTIHYNIVCLIYQDFLDRELFLVADFALPLPFPRPRALPLPRLGLGLERASPSTSSSSIV